jgi:two-component system sensor histidine kinase CreC
LIQNAIDFSPVGAAICIRVDSDIAGQKAKVTIDDEGAGIPDYALPRLFERFYSLQRPGNGRKSSGLGLCFVREAAALHGGSILVENKPEGHGVRAVLRLPLCAAPPMLGGKE